MTQASPQRVAAGISRSIVFGRTFLGSGPVVKSWIAVPSARGGVASTAPDVVSWGEMPMPVAKISSALTLKVQLAAFAQSAGASGISCLRNCMSDSIHHRKEGLHS